jgi:PadR family transcriptional regulator PadR
VIVQGALDMLILKTLALEPMHGYGIVQRIEQVSQGVFSVNAGSWFPAFCGLEREGRIKRKGRAFPRRHTREELRRARAARGARFARVPQKPGWKPTENNRRAKYYALTARGRKQLQPEADEWSRQSMAIARIMEAC